MSAVPAERRVPVRLSDDPVADQIGNPVGKLAVAEPGAAPEASRWPKSFVALQVLNYRIYFGSQIVATTGLWMQRIAQDWMISQLTGSAAAVGITVACQFLPVLFFGMFGGLVADRLPKRRVLMVTQSVAASMAALLGVLAITGVVQAWHVFAIAVMLGFVTVVDNPTRQAFVSDLVGRDYIRNAVSLNSSVFQLGGLIGPAISGILIHAIGQGPSFLINSGACLLVVTLLGIMKVPSAVAAKPAQSVSIARQLSEGLGYIRRTPEVLWTIVLVTALALFGTNMPVLLTAFATNVFPGGVGGYSLFNTLVAVGSLAGALYSARRTDSPRLRFLVSALGGLGIGLILASRFGWEPLFCLTLVGIGMMSLLFMTSANSLVQMTAPHAVRGRVMSVYLLMLLGCQAIGGPIVGVVIDRIGVQSTMLLCGSIVGLAAVGAGLAMARQSKLTVSVSRSRMPLQIVHR
ncbi:MFS transporter [Microlunatus endophyticus]|uniref:MFS transporter n=1 Tax=Microlunatus endophyticus TaxID=1716077 RepID=A0A917S5Z4_9ACTN|nr:MFS transporter [Microlunatus endophyticus]